VEFARGIFYNKRPNSKNQFLSIVIASGSANWRRSEAEGATLAYRRCAFGVQSFLPVKIASPPEGGSQ